MKKITFSLLVALFASIVGVFAANVTVKVKAPAGTTELYFYLHANGGNYLPEVGWPGEKMTLGNDGFFSYTFSDAYAEGAGGIINDNNVNDLQVDMPGNAFAGGCFELSPNWGISATTCPAVEGGEKVTLKVPDSWTDDVYLYIYDETDKDNVIKPLGGWPGSKMTVGAGGVLEASFDNDGMVYAAAIFNNNNVSQIDVPDDILNGGCFELISWTNVTVIPCSGDSEPIVVKFKAPTTWSEVKAHIWEEGGSGLTGDWPGAGPLAQDANGYYTYTITNYTSLPLNVIFNNGGNGDQTHSLTDVSTNYCWNAEEITGQDDYGNNLWSCIVNENCTATGLNDILTEDAVQIYPNPTADVAYFFAPEGTSRILLYSALGEQVKEILPTENSATKIDLSSLPKGIYYITVLATDGSKVSKAIVKI